jgi:hypothetical protein
LYNAHDDAEKVNPRGVATDGTNNFWGCGNAGGTLYFNPAGGKTTVQFQPLQNSRAAKIINGVLYVALNGPDGKAVDEPAGIYRFTDQAGSPLPLPRQADATIDLVVPASTPYLKNVGFDLNADQTVAYMSDTLEGIQKYVKSGGTWKLAYNFPIPQCRRLFRAGRGFQRRGAGDLRHHHRRLRRHGEFQSRGAHRGYQCHGGRNHGGAGDGHQHGFSRH